MERSMDADAKFGFENKIYVDDPDWWKLVKMFVTAGVIISTVLFIIEIIRNGPKDISLIYVTITSLFIAGVFFCSWYRFSAKVTITVEINKAGIRVKTDGLNYRDGYGTLIEEYMFERENIFKVLYAEKEKVYKIMGRHTTTRTYESGWYEFYPKNDSLAYLASEFKPPKNDINSIKKAVEQKMDISVKNVNCLYKPNRYSRRRS